MNARLTLQWGDLAVIQRGVIMGYYSAHDRGILTIVPIQVEEIAGRYNGQWESHKGVKMAECCNIWRAIGHATLTLKQFFTADHRRDQVTTYPTRHTIECTKLMLHELTQKIVLLGLDQLFILYSVSQRQS